MAEPADAVSIESGEPISARPRAIRFSAAMDMVILETVNEVGAHISQYGQSQKLFERAANACRAHVSFANCNLSVKSVWDRFNKLMSEHKKADAANRGASGIVEEYGPKEELLQEMMEAIREKDEQERVNRGERREAESRLLEAGENMRTCALQRKRRRETSPGNGDSVNYSEGERSDIDGMPKSDYELIQHAEERQKRREELEMKRFALQETTARLEQAKIEFLKRRCESDETKVNVEKQRLLNDSIRHQNEERRLQIDVERHNMEKEHRAGMLDLMGALIEKLKK
jgi:hypothetical protein